MKKIAYWLYRQVDVNRKASAAILRTTLLLLFFVLSALLKGQLSSSNFEHFTVKDGLPSQLIYNCYQDREGFLWIATDAGVSRFDGRTFKNFTISDGLGDNEIHEICGDKHGRVWFIPFSGKPSYYYKQKIYDFDVDSFLKKPSLRAGNHLIFGEDREGTVFMSKSSSKNVVKLPLNDKPVVYDLSAILNEHEKVETYYSPVKSKVYCITNLARLILLDSGVAKDASPAKFLCDEKPKKFYINHRLDDGYVLFSGEKGVYKFSGKGAQLLLPNEKLPRPYDGEYIYAQLDHFNNLWLNHPAHNTLFYKYSKGIYADRASVLNNAFASVSFDTENNIWFTANDGLYKTTFAKIESEQASVINRSLVARAVTSCAIDRDSGLWLGYSNGFVSRIKGHLVKHYKVSLSRKTNNRVVEIKPDSKGNLLIGTDETITLIRRISDGVYSEPVRFVDPSGTPARMAIKHIFFNSSGTAFLVQPFGGCIFQINPGLARLTMRYKNISKLNSRIFFSFFDKRDRLYTSSIEGLTVFENDSLVDLTRRDARLKNRIQGVAESRDGTIFIATYNYGLIAVRNKQVIDHLQKFNNQGVICRRIHLRNDTIYVATNYGIGVLTFKNDKFELIAMLTTSDGLISNDVNDLAFLGTQLYAATSLGVSLLETAFKPKAQAAAPILVLQNLKADDSLCNLDKELELSYKTKLIHINFIAPVLDRPELTLYRYRFNNADSWQTTAANFIEFGKLKPGNYAIEIQAKKYNSPWSSPGLINIRVDPPFYSTIWFACTVIAALGAFLYLIIRAGLQRRFRNQLIALQKKEAIEKERNRIAADIHDDIGAELTNIAMLSQILKHDVRTGISSTLDTVDKIESAAKQVITKIDEVVWTLNARNYTLKKLMLFIRNYLGSLGESLSAGFTFTIAESTFTDQELAGELTRNIYLAVKELMQNASKHSGAATVRLSISLPKQNTLQVDYEDNGVGFNLEEVNKGAEGNGLRNIKQRVTQSNGSVDIYTQKNEGCRIKIVFPINQLNNEQK